MDETFEIVSPPTIKVFLKYYLKSNSFLTIALLISSLVAIYIINENPVPIMSIPMILTLAFIVYDCIKMKNLKSSFHINEHAIDVITEKGEKRIIPFKCIVIAEKFESGLRIEYKENKKASTALLFLHERADRALDYIKTQNAKIFEKYPSHTYIFERSNRYKIVAILSLASTIALMILTVSLLFSTQASWIYFQTALIVIVSIATLTSVLTLAYFRENLSWLE